MRFKSQASSVLEAEIDRFSCKLGGTSVEGKV